MRIVMYRKSDGTSPVQEFIASLDDKMQAKVIRAIDMLEQRGSQLRVPISKELDEGIFERRISLAGNATRILYFFVIGNMAVLTNGFIKKTMKTPRYEIERAKRYRAEYLRRGTL